MNIKQKEDKIFIFSGDLNAEVIPTINDSEEFLISFNKNNKVSKISILFSQNNFFDNNKKCYVKNFEENKIKENISRYNLTEENEKILKAICETFLIIPNNIRRVSILDRQSSFEYYCYCEFKNGDIYIFLIGIDDRYKKGYEINNIKRIKWDHII